MSGETLERTLILTAGLTRAAVERSAVRRTRRGDTHLEHAGPAR
jgi:hypothetical protein